MAKSIVWKCSYRNSNKHFLADYAKFKSEYVTYLNMSYIPEYTYNFFFAKTAGQGQGQVSIYSSSLSINNLQQKTCLINSKKDAVICVLLGIHTAAVIIFI